MKVKSTDYKVSNPKNIPPPVPLNQEEVLKAEKESGIKAEIQKLKLKVDPKRKDSEQYSIEVATIDNPSTTSYLVWRRAFDRVVEGMALSTGPKLYGMARTLLRGRMERTFEKAAKKFGDETVENFQLVLNELSVEVFPPKAMVKQKRWMRRYMRKPFSTDIRNYSGLIAEMNASFRFFPNASEDDALKEEELVDIIDAGLPKAWTHQMLVQDFDPAEHSLHDLIDFCERLQTAEQIYENSNKSSNKGQKASRDGKSGDNEGGERSAKRGSSNYENNSRKKRRGQDGSRTGKWCTLHEVDSHNTGECKALLDQAKKMKAAWNTAKETRKANFKRGYGGQNESNQISSKSEDRRPSRSRSRGRRYSSSGSERYSDQEEDYHEFRRERSYSRARSVRGRSEERFSRDRYE